MNYLISTFISLVKEELKKRNVEETKIDAAIYEAEQSPELKNAIAIDALSNYISDDDIVTAYNNIIEQAGVDDGVCAGDVVTMWEPFEYRFTIKDLVEIIES